MNRAPTLGRSAESEPVLPSLQSGLHVLVEYFVERVASRVVEKLGAEPPAPAKQLLTKQDLAQAWSCSVSSIDRLRLEGLPTVLLGESPRFCPDAALEFLRSRGAIR